MVIGVCKGVAVVVAGVVAVAVAVDAGFVGVAGSAVWVGVVVVASLNN